MLQQVCNNKVSMDRIATAGLPQQGFHRQVCYNRLSTIRFPGARSLQQVCNSKVSRDRFATAGLPNRSGNSNDPESFVPTSKL